MSRAPSPDPDVSARSTVALFGLPEPEAILFDLDGTLVDTVSVRIRAWQEALHRFGLEVAWDRLGAYIGSDGRWLAGELARDAGLDFDWETTDRVDRLSGAIFDELNVSPAPLPGARDLLCALEASRLTWAIATSSQPGQVQMSVSALRLPAPPPVTDGGHVERAKPEPDLLLAAAAQLRVAPERCWYVGDSTWDMLAGRRAGMSAVAVTTGAASAEALLAAGADAAVSSLDLVAGELARRGLIDREAGPA
jgi:HAD superfamily hydrolase (TIGR01509 family)